LCFAKKLVDEFGSQSRKILYLDSLHIHKFMALAVLVGVAVPATLVLRDELITSVNAKQSGWVAGRNARFEGVTIEEARQMLGVLPSPTGAVSLLVETPVLVDPVGAGKYPSEFDSRTQWPGCVVKIRDQAKCGGCWAFSSAEVLGNRFCIASGGKINVSLSVDDLMGCWVSDMYNHGCDGGVPEMAWRHYMYTPGLVTEKCFPFTAANANGTTPKCAVSGGTCAVAGVPFKKYKAAEGSVRVISSYYWAVQQEIATNGPVSASFTVYEDFFSYKSGIYKHVSGAAQGKHAVKLVGYGVDNSTGIDQKYWIVANSWGEEWGMEGYFKIALGTDESNIEDSMVYGTPDLSGH
jgi:cathepsin B